MSSSVKKKAFDETSPQKVLFCYIKMTIHNNISKIPLIRILYFRLSLRTSGLLIDKIKCACNPDPFTALFCRLLLMSRIYATILSTLDDDIF